MKLLSSLLLVLFFVAIVAAAEKTRPNVLLICVDDLKPQLGCYGDKLAKSPNIDRLASRGMVFNSAYCNQAVCSPSRNSLLVGLRPQTLGIYDLGTNFRKSAPQAVTLPQYFKQQGYRTEAMGKLFHVGHGNNEDATSWSVPHFQAKTVQYALKANQAEETREGALFSNKPAGNLPKGAAYEAADVSDSTYGDGIVADEAVKRIEALKEKPDQPFFLAVGFLKPHLPFCAPQKYWDLYDPEKLDLAAVTQPPKGAPSYAPQFGGELRNYKDIPVKGDLPADLQRKLIHGYYAATSYMDAQLGRVLTALDDSGLSGNTIVVLWGDHGWHLGDHGIWCKHTNYEQAARIPVVVALPKGAQAGTKTSALIETVDIYPTLCELTGLPIPTGLDGSSFAKTLSDPKSATKDSIIHVYPRGKLLGRAVRTARYRLVEWKEIGASPETAELELYDYQTDPLETKNLAAELPTVVAELRANLAKHPEAKPQIKAAANTGSKPAAKKSQDRGVLFASKDKDGDGKLTREEFLANQPDPDEAPQRFVQFDVDKNGSLTRAEFVTSGGKNPNAK
ncbi:Arylsulfatase [Anatilimnocola aggregata]|uniref:Arylsulfatase n=1 Tax=Anatilimnocola aggregata TaxID=2528021 RepID=A0A517YCC9_9BACT|nr:sulfatase-like hydrolase/transferase [Anatilimnocola aggregata]QDU27897.1 Arylsulfatase [Anatilimnocola aggregata]